MIRFAWVGVFILIGLGTAVPAQARSGGTTVGASLDVAGPPVSGWGTAIGFTVEATHEFERNLAVIGGMSYYNWDWDDSDFSFRRVPFDLGLRAYLPANRHLRFYAQGELEISVDRVGDSNQSHTAAHVGVVPGVGLDYAFSRSFSALIGFKYHIIKHDYYVFNFGGAFHF